MNHKKHISVSFLGLLFFFLINLDNTSGIPIISSQAETDSNAIFQFVHKSISTTAPDSELFYFEKAIQIVSQKVPDEKKTDFLLAIAEQYENHDKYRDALEVYRKVLSIYKERNNKEGIASVTGAIGNIYYFRSIFDKALQYYQEALKLNEEIANKKKVAANLGNIGNIFFLQGEPQQALDFYKKALYIQNQIDDSIGIAKSYINIANVFSDKEEFLDQALAYYNKAYEIQNSLKDTLGIALAYTNIGSIYERKKNSVKALSLYQKSLYLNKKIGNKRGMAYNYLAIAGLLFNKGFYKESIYHAKKCSNLSKEIGNIQIRERALELMADALSALKDYQQALKYKNMAFILKDSIFNLNKAQALAQLQIKYDSEKKEKKILEQENEIKNNELQLAKEKAENEKQAFQRKLLLISLLISFILIFVILYSRKQIRKTNVKLILTNQELSKSLEVIRKQKEIIQENEEIFRRTINAANDAIILIDNDEKIIIWNNTAEKMFGYSKKEVLNKNIHDLITPKKYRDTAHKAFSIFRKTGRGNALNKTIEMEGLKKNGEIFPVELSLSSIMLKKKLNAIGIVRDISRRKENERKLKEVNKQKAILINNIPAGIFYKDLNLRYIEINKSFADMMGRKPEEIIGKTDKDLLPDEEFLEYEKADLQVISSKSPLTDIVKEHTNNNNIKYWISTSKIPYFNTNNEISGIIGVVRDITKHIENERAIEESKNKLEEAYKNITDNISYAKFIQHLLLPDKTMLNRYLPNYFLFYLPKGIIGGDFYFINKIDKYLVFAVADCTGHGVSGALLSILGITFLHEIINDTLNPGEVLNLLRSKIKNLFKTFGSRNMNGMDIALAIFNTENYQLKYAGAFNPMWIIRDDHLLELKATRSPIGYYYSEKTFTVTTVEIKKNDIIYMFSDGYADQFGGNNNVKFKKKNLRKLFLQIRNKPMKEQKKIIEHTFYDWKRNNDQVDDITILGVKF